MKPTHRSKIDKAISWPYTSALYQPLATPEGIRINAIYYLKWGQIVSCELRRRFNLPYITVRHTKRKIWLLKVWGAPLHLGNGETFLEQIREFSPPEHPMRELLKDETYTAAMTKFPRWLGYLNFSPLPFQFSVSW